MTVQRLLRLGKVAVPETGMPSEAAACSMKWQKKGKREGL